MLNLNKDTESGVCFDGNILLYFRNNQCIGKLKVRISSGSLDSLQSPQNDKLKDNNMIGNLSLDISQDLTVRVYLIYLLKLNNNLGLQLRRQLKKA